MRQNKIILPVAVLMAFSTISAKASVNVEWLDNAADFGVFHEAAGNPTLKLRMVNRGDAPVVITGTRVSCGCTLASYTEDPVLPGDTAYVAVTYNAKGRPGKFDKTVKVYVGDDYMRSFPVRGTVIGAPQTLENQYPLEAGPLRLSGNAVYMGEIRKGETRQAFINAYNQSSDTITVRPAEHEKMLSVDASTERIAPGELATYSVYFNTLDEPEYGFIGRFMKFIAESPDGTVVSLSVPVEANVIQNFSNLTPESEQNAPRIVVYPDRLDVGNIDSDKELTLKFKIKNSGKTVMKVERIYSLNSDIKVHSSKEEVKAGNEMKVELTLNPANLPEGAFNVPVFIIANDPHSPVTTLSVVGNKP